MNASRSTVFLLVALLLGAGATAAPAGTVTVTGPLPGKKPVPVTLGEAPSSPARGKASVAPQAATGVSPWTHVGPVNQPGRTRVACLDGSGFTLFVGSDEGGFWQGDPLFDYDWTPAGDELGTGVHFMADGYTFPPAEARGGRPLIRPQDTQGLIERLAVSSDVGDLAYTDDYGYSFTDSYVPLNSWSRVRRLVRDGNFANVMYALVQGDSGFGLEWDVLVSYDAGATYSIVYQNYDWEIPDLFVLRNGTSGLYFVGGDDGDVQVSTDQGTTWNSVGQVAPGLGDDWTLTGCEAGVDVQLYAVAYDLLYRSDDGGVTWNELDYLPNFDAQYGHLCGSIGSYNTVVYGVDNRDGCGYSTDGGVTFTVFDSNDWPFDGSKLCPSIAGIDCLLPAYFPAAPSGPAREASRPRPGGKLSPQSPVDNLEVFYINTGGGTYIWTPGSPDPPVIITVTDFTNGEYNQTTARLRQGYPFDMVMGSRDRSEQSIDFSGSPPAYAYTFVASGAGPDVGYVTCSHRIRPDNPYVWSMFNGDLIVLVGPDAFNALYGPFESNAPPFPYILADPENPFDLLWCGQQLYRIHYDQPSNSFTTTLISSQNFSGDGVERLTALGISPADNDYWYAITSLGRIFASTDAGVTWILKATNGPGEAAAELARSAIAPSPTDRLTCTFGGAGYVNEPVLQTIDGGATFTDISAGLPSDCTVWDMAYDNNVDQNLYAATSVGPHVLTGGGWVDMAPAYNADGVPQVPFRAVESIPSMAVMRFSTYGRGIFDYATGSVVGVPEAKPAIAGLGVQPLENPMHGAGRLSLSLPAATTATVEAFDLQGRKIATLFTGTLEAGVHMIDFPARDGTGAPLPGGVYFVRATTPGAASTGKVILAR